MNTAALEILVHEATRAAQSETTLEGRMSTVFKVAREHWMITDEHEQLQGALAALVQLSDEETKERILAEVESIKYLNAMLSGVAVDLDRVPKLEKPIGLMGKWHDTKSGKGAL